MRKHLLGLILLGMVSAVAAFPANVYVVDRVATVDDPAEFQLEVENNFTDQTTFRVSSISSPPPTGSWIGYGNSQSIQSGEKANFSLNVVPPETAIQQNYRFDVNIRTLEGNYLRKVSSYFSVKSRYDLNIMSASINSDSFEPGSRLLSNITVFNTASSSKNYNVKVSALNQTTEKLGAIVSGSERSHGFSFNVPRDISPGVYEINLEIVQNGEVGDTVTQEFEVLPVENIEYSSKSTDTIFEYSETVYATNTGNNEAEVELNKTLPDYLAPITSFNRTADRKVEENGATTYYWSNDIEPGQRAAVSYRTYYWPPLVVLSALFVGILVLKRFYSGIKFSKEVRATSESVKVHLEVENRSNHKVENLNVTDFVPDIASVKEEFPMAKPVIRKTSNGTRLVWEIEAMEPGEQRVFEYTITPLVEVEGGVTLPEAELEMSEERIKQTGKQTVDFKPE